MEKRIRKKLIAASMALAMVISLLPAMTLTAMAADKVYTWGSMFDVDNLNPAETYEDTINGLTITAVDCSGSWVKIYSSGNGWLLTEGGGNLSLEIKKTNGTLFSPDPIAVSVKSASGSDFVTISGYNSSGTLIASQAFSIDTTGTEVDLTNVNSTPLTNIKTLKFECSASFYITNLTLGSSASAPTVLTGAADNITSSGATLNGTVNDNGGDTTVTFEYGADTSYGSSVSATTPSSGTLSSGSGNTSVSATLTGISTNTTYHYRVKAENSEGTTYGSDKTFTTSGVVPTVTTQAVSSITSTTAIGNGNITAFGTPAPTAHGVCWNKNGNPTTADGRTDEGDASSTGAFTSSITGLSPNTTYYVRAYATNPVGTSYGAQVSFTTSIAPSSDAMLKASSTVKGQTVTSLGTPNATLGSETAGAVTITAAKAADTGNATTFITLFDKNDAKATVRVVKYASGKSTANFETDTVYGNEVITNGDFFIIKVTAEDGTTVNFYKVNVTVTPTSSTAKAITVFDFKGVTPNVTGTVNEGAKTIALTVPYGTDVTTLVPTIMHTGTSVSPNTGAAQNFTNPVTYTVTAADSSTQVYTVTVTVANNAELSGLSLSSGTLSPAFANSTTCYTASVAYGVSSITLTPAIADSNATVTVNGITVTSGNASGAINLNVGANTITVVVTAQDGTTTNTYTVTVTRAVSSGGSSGGRSSTTTQQSQNTSQNTVVVVNGKEQNAGKETQKTEDGRSTVTVEVDNKTIGSNIDDAIKNNATGTGNFIQVPVADTKAEVAKVELTGDIVKKLEENTFDVSLKRDNIEYVIPAAEFTISKVAEDLGIKEKALADIKVEVKITKLGEKVVEKYNEVAKTNGAEFVFSPVQFEITAKTTDVDGTTKEHSINKFSNYVERIMEIPAGVDPSKITTGIVFNSDATYSHVPTEVYQKDGKWYAKLNSLTNSDYSVIWNSVTVKTVENHWSKDAVNDMASRLVIFNPQEFEPNRAITRADFAEYIVRALGLYREDSTHENNFVDVTDTGERTLGILIANEYGIVSGYSDGTFRGDNQITREEAMAMYQRAMKITKLVGSDENRYQNYTDYSQVSDWATSYVKEVLSAHVFNGTTETKISPKASLTYAEAAQAVRNLLIESKLISE